MATNEAAAVKVTMSAIMGRSSCPNGAGDPVLTFVLHRTNGALRPRGNPACNRLIPATQSRSLLAGLALPFWATLPILGPLFLPSVYPVLGQRKLS